MAIDENGFIQKVIDLAASLDDITLLADLFTEENVAAMEAISATDLATLAEDINKSNYAGKRKLDIDLDLNNNSEVTNVAYQSANVLLNSGVNIQIVFYTIPGDTTSGITELTSHTDIKAYIAADAGYIANVTGTELTVEPAIGTSPELIRFRDSDIEVSNISNVTLGYFSGDAIDTAPLYYWTKTTSSIQLTANNIQDIITVSEGMEGVLTLSGIAETASLLEELADDIRSIADLDVYTKEQVEALVDENTVALTLALS